ncbi:hypothetical protein BJ741DRAFT_678331 [Chytriomyces cf. hyalinus JEL632]|nr:hypothetical protein BJ741DRAFT_678331 [Chytriomyces cf. hyalinus JEL632]
MQWTRTVLAVLISIWTVGFLLNGFILLAMVLRTSLFIFNEHLRTIGTLLLLCQTWSLVNVINDVVYLLYGNHDSSFYAILSNTVLILIFGANFILSLERFYTVCKEESLRLRHYLVIYSVLLVFIVAVVAVIIVSPAELDFQPAELNYFVIWRTLITSCFSICLIGMIFCYTRTYRYTTQLIAQSSSATTTISESVKASQTTSTSDSASIISWENETETVDSDSLVSPEELAYRQRIAWCVLKSCIVMSSAMVLCYIPYVVWLHTADYWANPSTLFGNVVSGMAALDVFLTPGLILYLKRDIREACVALLLSSQQ